jgi:hypothetical protein
MECVPVFDRLSLALAEVDLYRKCERARSAHLRTLSPGALAATDYRLLPRAEQKYRRAVHLAAIHKTGGSRAHLPPLRPGALEIFISALCGVDLPRDPLPPRPTRSTRVQPAE